MPFRNATYDEPQPDRRLSRIASTPPSQAAKTPSPAPRNAANAGKPSVPQRPRTAAVAPYLGAKAAAPAYYVEAGIFPERPLAERLAAILKDIAPASIEPVTHEGRPAHRIRLGPFLESKAASAAAARIKAAGLTGARLEDGAGG